MIILDSVNKSLEIKLAGAVTTNQLQFTTSYVELLDSDESVADVAESDGVTNNTTAVTMVSAPSALNTRQVKHVTVYNADTVAATVTLQINNGGTARILCKITLDVGDTLEYAD